MRKKSFSKQKKIYYVTLSLLLVFALCLIATGSWFTDTGSVKGDLTKPEIQPTLAYKSGSNYTDFGDSSIYWSSSSDNQEIYIKFDSANNVKNQICRIYFNVEWGTLSNGVWTANSLQHYNSVALQPKYTTSWTSGVNALTEAKVNAMLQEQGFKTDADYQELVDAGVYSSITEAKQDIVTSLIEESNQTIVPYYSSNVINIKSLTGPILVCSGFEFNYNVNASAFSGLTAKITISVEAEAVSDRVIGTKGYWMFDAGANKAREDRPSDQLVSNWKNSI